MRGCMLDELGAQADSRFSSRPALALGSSPHLPPSLPSLASLLAALLLARRPQYATHGGGFPLRVPNVEPLVGVVVVSGLAQEDDHQVIVDVLRKHIAESK